MIAINNYRQFISELVAAASQQSGVSVDHVRLAVTETQLTVLLKDLPGTVVCGNVPGFDIDYPSGYWHSTADCVLYVLEKMPRDRQNTEQEFQAYARLQRLVAHLLRLLTGEDFQQFCDQGELDRSQQLSIEWEYNTLGGFNGLSIGFRLKDGNGTSL